MSVTFNSEPSEMEMKLVNNIEDVNSKFILFNNIIFDCDQIKDAAGHVFLRDDPCKVVASSTEGLVSDTPRKWCQLSCGHSFTFAGLGSLAACIVCGRRVEGGWWNDDRA